MEQTTETLLPTTHWAPVPGKPIGANRELNPFNPGIKFILRSVSVPESMISAIQLRDKLRVKFNTPSKVD